MLSKSVYIRKLSEVNKATQGAFDAAAYAADLWKNKLPGRIDKAVSLDQLLSKLQANGDSAFAAYTEALAIGNYRYALVRVDGVSVEEVTEDEWVTKKVRIAREFIYGNALRDASGLVKVKDFPVTSELNQVSEELNQIVRKEVIEPIRDSVKTGSRLSLVGAIELHKSHLTKTPLEIIPVQIHILR